MLIDGHGKMRNDMLDNETPACIRCVPPVSVIDGVPCWWKA